MVSHRRSLPPATQAPLFHLRCHPKTDIRHQARTTITTRRSRDICNSHLLEGLTVEGYYGIPVLEGQEYTPDRLICFSEAIRMTEPDPGAWVHFYEDDWKFRCFWEHPEKYRKKLKGFAGIIEPDCSVYENMLLSQKITQTFQNRLLGAWCQKQGMRVIANVRLSGTQSIPYALAGVPRESTIALGLHGCIKDPENRARVIEEMRIIVDHLAPKKILIYGSDAYGVADWPREHDIPVHVYPPDTWTRSQDRKKSRPHHTSAFGAEQQHKSTATPITSTFVATISIPSINEILKKSIPPPKTYMPEIKLPSSIFDKIMEPTLL